MKKLIALAAGCAAAGVALLTGCAAEDRGSRARRIPQTEPSSPWKKPQKRPPRKPAAEETPAEEEAEEPAEPALPDGVYTAEFNTDSSMFHANEACDGKGTLTVEERSR